MSLALFPAEAAGIGLLTCSLECPLVTPQPPRPVKIRAGSRSLTNAGVQALESG